MTRKPLQVAPEPRWVVNIVIHDQAGTLLPEPEIVPQAPGGTAH